MEGNSWYGQNLHDCKQQTEKLMAAVCRGNSLRKTPRKVAAARIHFPLKGLPLPPADGSIRSSPSRTNPIRFLSCVDQALERWTGQPLARRGTLSESPLP